jgi:hypothetical protein
LYTQTAPLLLGFEYAAQPGLSDKEKAEKLHFAVVGGGPTVSDQILSICLIKMILIMCFLLWREGRRIFFGIA